MVNAGGFERSSTNSSQGVRVCRVKVFVVCISSTSHRCLTGDPFNQALLLEHVFLQQTGSRRWLQAIRNSLLSRMTCARSFFLLVQKSTSPPSRALRMYRDPSSLCSYRSHSSIPLQKRLGIVRQSPESRLASLRSMRRGIALQQNLWLEMRAWCGQWTRRLGISPYQGTAAPWHPLYEGDLWLTGCRVLLLSATAFLRLLREF